MASTTVDSTTLENTSEEPTASPVETSVDANGNNEAPSETDRFQQRLDRFGTIAPEAKKLSRALRFGTAQEPVDNETKKRRLERFGVVADTPENVQEKKRQRAERFNVNSPTVVMDEETKQKRINRFGVVTPSAPANKTKQGTTNASAASSVITDAIKKRAERFGDVSTVAKAHTQNEQKAKRAERFKTSA